jgi:hypothetical protein
VRTVDSHVRPIFYMFSPKFGLSNILAGNERRLSQEITPAFKLLPEENVVPDIEGYQRRCGASHSVDSNRMTSCPSWKAATADLASIDQPELLQLTKDLVSG